VISKESDESMLNGLLYFYKNTRFLAKKNPH